MRMKPIAFRTWGSNPLAPSGLSMQRDWQNLAGTGTAYGVYPVKSH